MTPFENNIQRWALHPELYDLLPDKTYIAQGQSLTVPQLEALVLKARADIAARKPTLILHDTRETIVVPQASSLVTQLIYQQATTALTGKPKVGKTTFLLDAIHAILTHQPFLKLETTPTSVIYISEQPLSSFAAEVGNSGLFEKRNHDEVMFFGTIEDWFKLTWTEIIELVGGWQQKLNAGLIVFDTLSRIARAKDEKDASVMQEAIDIATPLLKTGAASIFGQHERKSGGDIFDAGRGSNAIAGAVDVIMRLQHPSVGKQPDTYRELEYVGRFPGPGSGLIIDRKTSDANSRYEYLGAEHAVKAHDAEQTILNLFRAENEWASKAQIITSTSLDKNAVDRALVNLVKDGIMEEAGEGKKGSPHVYRAKINL